MLLLSFLISFILFVMLSQKFSRLVMAITKTLYWDFPGGPEVKNPSCNGGDAGLIPGWGIKIPQASEQASPRNTAREFREFVRYNKRSQMT